MTTEQSIGRAAMAGHPTRRVVLLGVFGAAGTVLAGGCASRVAIGPEAVAGKTPDGTVELSQVQVAYLGSGSTGRGVLRHRGRSYPFSISGLGVGGVGASTIEASGEVYNLPDAERFRGTYGQARYGFALGSMSGGDLWMQNEAGVIMHLKAKRQGLMLSLGGDAMLVSM
ncbi:hypothetical protein JMJ55_27855 [Belnapia sp. T6]|uniref:Uncharacterized protein n=1 Tax=Belnapia mucosa TaxID=2804532 RepID=A0ABS1VCY2_9PROT|nr:hypothetical protein [Belnapia mucosa]MBL6459142.1 hypothetical protein [Belnapia mucosa]